MARKTQPGLSTVALAYQLRIRVCGRLVGVVRLSPLKSLQLLPSPGPSTKAATTRFLSSVVSLFMGSKVNDMLARASINVGDGPSPCRKSARVTIIIGFASKDGIILASDSQGTYPDGSKEKSLVKIFPVRFKLGTAAICFSGYLEPARTFVELFRERASKRDLGNYRTPAKVAEESADEHQRMLLKECRDRGLRGKQRDRYLQDREYTILIASYCESAPHLFVLPSRTRKAMEETSLFVADGNPYALAKFITEGIDFPNLEMREALPLAAFLVNACIEYDSYCDRPLQMAVLSRQFGEYHQIPKIMIKAHEGAARAARIDLQQDLADNLRQRFDAYAAEHLVPESAKKRTT
jgi:20S proteasome alpha/beta subunit